MDLRFHLAGINNQNFLMRDEQTGSYWQQITGLAIAGPLAGQRLQLIAADELTYATWRQEEPAGTVLNDVPTYVSEYAPKDWDLNMEKVPTVINYAQPGLQARDLMLGVHSSDAARAFPYKSVLRDKLIQDRLGWDPIILVVASDNRSVRVFKQRIPGLAVTPQFYRLHRANSDALFLDAETTGLIGGITILLQRSTGSRISNNKVLSALTRPVRLLKVPMGSVRQKAVRFT
jgi:hypothetical protein